MRRLRTAAFLLCLAGLPSLPAPSASPLSADDTNRATERPPRHLLLVTLDTTRADALGIYGGKASTPTLDALARRGTLWRRALASAPLTLPSHASLMTGRTPPAHGVRDNATDALADDVPTLAGVLSARGFHTVAVVASRVLDRRFGLAQGFDVYDDHMPAEARGEYGYPERRADAVVDSALRRLKERPGDAPLFLWVHFYDPHAPYTPPSSSPSADGGQSREARYHGEIEFCDGQLARLLEALPDGTLVAVVGDHGEALGEHGEDTHGLFLYEAALRVPMIVSGPGVPQNREVKESVAALKLAPKLLGFLGIDASALLGPESADTVGPQRSDEPGGGVYSETLLPASAYGWSSLHAVTDDRYRYILAPRPELYDLGADPSEGRNLASTHPEVAARLRGLVEDELSRAVDRREAALDEETRSELEALGYLSGSSDGGVPQDGAAPIDPKDGLARLARFDRAKELRNAGNVEGAIALFAELLETNPDNGPVRTHLAEAWLAAGRPDRSLALYREAAERRPDFEFARFQLASALLNQGQLDEGRAELKRVLAIDSRFADAWLTLAELAHRAGDGAEELRLLNAAEEAGTESAALFVRLGMRLASGDGADPERAADMLRRATDTTPGWAVPWLIRGQVLLQQGKNDEAKICLAEAARLAPPSSAERAQARRLLGSLK